MAFELETAFFFEVRSTQIKKPGLKLVYLPGKGHVIVLIFFLGIRTQMAQ